VTTAGAVTRRIQVQLPGWLYGDDPQGFGAQAALEFKAIDHTAGTWTMSPLERVRRSPAANLIRTQQIAGRGTHSRFDLLEALGRTAPVDEPRVRDVRGEVHQMIKERPGDIGKQADQLLTFMESLTLPAVNTRQSVSP
jgi:hypothetical protein